MSTSIGIPDIRERDIDFLLLEELVASSAFLANFLEHLGLPPALSLIEAQRSVNSDTGESDLELTAEQLGRRVKILVENKIDAAFQPEQPERYYKRAQAFRQTGQFTDVRTVIFAPAVYFSSDDEQYGFDSALTYETAVSWIEATHTDTPRRDFKLAMLQGAIERGRQGWVLVPCEPVSRFWRQYWELAQELAPILEMPYPKGEIPANSHFIVFQPSVLPSDVKLKHKVGYGHLDIELRGKADRLAELRRSLGATLPEGVTLERASKSAVIRARVPPIDMVREPFDQRTDAVREALEVAVRLLTWYEETIRTS